MAISNSSAAVPTIRVNALLRLVTWLPRLRSPIRYRSMRRHGTPSLPETALNRLDNSPAGLAEADAQRAEQPSQRPAAVPDGVDRDRGQAVLGKLRREPDRDVCGVLVATGAVPTDHHRPSAHGRGPGRQEEIEVELVRALDARRAGAGCDRRDDATGSLVVGGEVLAEGERADHAGDDIQPVRPERHETGAAR